MPPENTNTDCRRQVAVSESGAGEQEGFARNHSLAQLADGRFGEYYEPFPGEPLGSDEQSWTAAVALDWLANEEEVSE